MMTGYSAQTRRRFGSFQATLALVGLLAGCAGSGGDTPTSGLERAERSVVADPGVRPADGRPAPAVDLRVAAEADGVGIRWGELTPRLIESSGRAVIEEMVLDLRLERRCARAGIVIGDAALAREEALIERAIVGAGVAPNSEDADRLLERVRRERGLGELRWADLIRRNAMLRALIEPASAPTDSELQRAYATRYGERHVVRLVTSPTLEEATRISELARGGTDFAELATRFSTDVSASRGGLLGPMSTSDESYPHAVREAVARLHPGEVSGAVALEEGFAVVRLDRVTPPKADAPPIDAVRGQLAEEARLRRERILMSELATRLRAGADEVRVFDAELREAWLRR